ncbi:Kae1-associated serine/threonine protein kinase [Candidatus Micrarchaeota archaeon]|jgi:Kae1-associated kinase Bud32|nr:Kae1-associated serine/threonine protein kinase [Candidatus Micrarchaeota archaeon]
MQEFKGAEAIVYPISYFDLDVLVKERIEKSYREKTLDIRLRTERTRQEAKLLTTAKESGILCPIIYDIYENKIILKRVEGKMLYDHKNISKSQIKHAAEILAKLHKLDIIHGDYTPANLIQTKKGLVVIDFGLGYFSKKIEDKAMDVVTMKKALGEIKGIFFLDEYKSFGDKDVLTRADIIENRVRYAKR